MAEKIKKIITVLIFLVIIFVMAVFSVLNLVDKYKDTEMPPFAPASFENDFKSNLYLRNEMIEFQGFTQKLIFNNEVEDPELGAIVKNKWGQLTSLPKESNLEKFKANLDTITDACEENNIKQIYVQAPFIILPQYEKEQLPIGFATAANENADKIIAHMKDRQVEVYDFRDVLSENCPIPKENLFYKTDHHWTIETAFYAFTEFYKHLNGDKYSISNKQEFGLVTDKNNYNHITMKNCYLGSWGRRTGVLYAGLDDFTYLVPDFETDISIKRVAGEAKYEARGNFYDVVMSPKRVDKENFGPSEEELAAGFGSNGIYTDLYSAYMDGFTAEMQMLNHSTSSKKKILIFHDSFGFPFSSFMALGFKETRVIDLRNWHEDINQYISDYEPHFVVTLYNPDQ